jgi:hypothetical protein
MLSSSTVKKDVPALTGDFSLIPVEERLRWRDALSRHLLNQMYSPSGLPLSDWKVDEQVVPMNFAIAGLLEQGIVELRSIECRLCSVRTIRSNYASGK